MEELLLWEFPPKVRELATLFFFWSGVAVWIGLSARFLVPARVVRGPWLTLCLGFVGSCLGPFALHSFFNLDRFDPISPCGLLASIAAALATLCLFYAVAFFFPSRLDDEEDEEDEGNQDGASEENAEYEREKASDVDRWTERREASRRRQEYDRERLERGDRRERERAERGEYGRREYVEEESTNESNERDDERHSRPRRRR